MTQAFSIESAHLRKAAAAAHSIVSTNKAIPILNNVRLDAAAGQLRLLTTDQDCWAELTIPAVVGAEVSTTVAAALLNDIARNSPSGSQVEIEIKDTGASAKAGRARFRLPTLPADAFPPMNAAGLCEQVRIRVSDLLSAVGAVAHVKAEENKPHLQGILFRPLPGGIEFAAFDGKRLSRSTAEATVSEDFEPMTMPGAVVAKLRTILEGAGDEITIGHNGRLALIEGNGIRFLTRLVEGKFTPYWTRLPELNGDPVLFSAKDLMEALNRVGLVQDRHYSGVAVDLTQNWLTLSISNPAAGDVNEAVPVAYDGPEKRLGYNLRFLRDAVMQCPGDEAEFHIDAEGAAHIFSRATGAPRHMMAPMRA
ncbi:MAG: DNA polymerase III subunit beta [Sphingobium limneticum]